MSITCNSSVNGGQTSGFPSSHSFSVTVAGGLSNSILIVMAKCTAGTTVITGVTWNGQSLTKLVDNFATGVGTTGIWYLLNPNAATANVVISSTGAAEYVLGEAAVYTGVNQTDPFDGSDTDGGTGTSFTCSVTTTTVDGWMVAGAFSQGVISAGTGLTIRVNNGNGSKILDSNGGLGAIASESGSITIGASSATTMVAAVLRELTASPLIAVIDATLANSRQLYSDNKATYALARDAASADTSDVIGASSAQNILHNSLAGNYYVRRAELQFDTSALAAGVSINAATLTLFSAASGGGDDQGYDVVLLDNTNNGNLQSPLATEDFDDFGSSSIGSRDLTALYNIGANVSIDLSSFACINGGGVTKIGLRLSGDINNNTPGGNNVLRIDTSGDVPYLTIYYSPSVDQTIQAKAGILNTQTGELQAKARVRKTVDQTIQAKSRIILVGTATIQAMASILNITLSKTIQAKAKIWSARLGVTYGKRDIKYVQEGKRFVKSG